MNQTILPILRNSMELIVERFEKNGPQYPFIDTKFNIVTGKDFGPNDELFRQKECIYSWIQGRGLESIAKHIVFFKKFGETNLASRLEKMLEIVTDKMEQLRKVNNGRLPFAMHPDGTSFFPKESTHANFSDLFYSKGLFAASLILKRPDLEKEAEKLFLFVLNEIDKNLFHTDQQCFDPKNKVSFIPGKFPQGPRMIALGGIADWVSNKPLDLKWAKYADKYIRFIWDHHINTGQYKNCEEFDFIESIDQDGQPWFDDKVLFSDPGHALEFVGLASKCLLKLIRYREYHALIEQGQNILPSVFRKVFDYGFNIKAGGICKGFDLTSRKVINSDLPWWNLPETVRAGHFLAKFSNYSNDILIRTGQAYQAFHQGFLQPNGFACQTRNEHGQIIDVIPAVSDADPGYHTNLSLMDVLDWEKSIFE
jgi:hypothetical protein